MVEYTLKKIHVGKDQIIKLNNFENDTGGNEL